ncbi:bifunctional DNA primase/polymerase [Streptomyces sp. NPDC006971]|uniref:bifunctional DNA primase/polymerase n=1 Tax=Streptomyces sp. NPDC006971 TaxID=3154784 RepID=UPI0033D9F3AE
MDTPDGRPAVNVADAQLGVAMTWVRRGFPVIPCSRTDKGAMVPGFGKGATADQLAPFADPDQVSRWWSSGRFARAHVGLLTGRGGADGRGLVVVDLDMPKPDAEPLTGRWAGCAGGTDVLELLMREAGAEWPDTYTVLTPSGGMHLYYLQPVDGDLIGCATGDGPRAPHIGPLVDVRGIGGYVIAAGSYSAAQGRPYTRVSDPGLLPQPLPPWLLALLRPAVAPPAEHRPAPVHQLPTGDRAERYAIAALNGETDKVSGAGAGQYWRLITASTFRLAELHHTAPHILTEQAVTDALVGAATQAGMEERAALKAVATAWERKAFGGAA